MVCPQGREIWTLDRGDALRTIIESSGDNGVALDRGKNQVVFTRLWMVNVNGMANAVEGGGPESSVVGAGRCNLQCLLDSDPETRQKP
jgi:nitrogenase subunit NifH